jgi:hypothetical protein
MGAYGFMEPAYGKVRPTNYTATAIACPNPAGRAAAEKACSGARVCAERLDVAIEMIGAGGAEGSSTSGS